MAKPVVGNESADKHPIHRLESLEARKMLTTIYGGETFEFVDPAFPNQPEGQVIRVVAQGDIVAELIGARDLRDGESNTIELGDLTGFFVTSDSGRAGTGDDNDQLIGRTVIAGLAPESTVSEIPDDGTDLVNIQAIASLAGGATYGFNILTNAGGTTFIQLLTFDTATGAATVVEELQGEFAAPPGDPLSIRAASFDPLAPNLLYFVGEFDVDGVRQDIMYTIDVFDADPSSTLTAITGTFGDDTTDNRRVESIAFDVDPGAATGRNLLALVSNVDAGDSGVTVQSTTVLSVDPTDTDSFVDLVDDPATPDNVETLGPTVVGGLGLVDDDVTQAHTDLLSASNDVLIVGSGRILSLDLSTRTVSDFGSSADQADNSPPTRGDNLGSLTYNPALLNPFTDELGVFLATDTATDELVYIGSRDFGFDQLFGIYITQAGPNASLSISTYHYANNQPDRLSPFTGVTPRNEQGNNSTVATNSSQYDLYVDGVQGRIVSFESGIGGVYIGAREYVPRTPNSVPEPLSPVIDGSLAERLGVYASGIDLSPEDNNDLVNVSAGIFVAPGLLNFLDGTNLLSEASITDSIDPLGNLPFDDLGVDASEVQALATNKNGETYGFNVVDGFDNGLPVKLVQLIEFQVDGINVGQGNVVAHLQGVLPLDDGGFSTVDSVQAAAFDPASGLLYFVAEANELGALVDRLYTVDVTAGDAAAIAATVTQISGSFGEVTPTIDPNAVASAVDTQKVRSIVFDQLTDTPGLETSRLIALIDTVSATSQPGFTVGDWVSTGVFQVTLTDTDTLTSLGAPVPAVEGPATAALGPNVGGIELISNDPLSDGHDNPSGQDDTLLAIQGTDANSQFLLIDLAAGTVTLEGLAVDLADTEGVVRGKSIGALTFDPTLLSPFTGRLGAYVGIDTATDEFVYVNPLGGKADNILDNHVGNNLDMIAEMGIRRDLGAADAIFVIDIDGTSFDGSGVGDQLSLIDPATGKSTIVADIVDSGNNPLANILAAAYGFEDLSAFLTGSETLYAVYNIAGTLTLGTLSSQPDLQPVDQSLVGIGGDLDVDLDFVSVLSAPVENIDLFTTAVPIIAITDNGGGGFDVVEIDVDQTYIFDSVPIVDTIGTIFQADASAPTLFSAMTEVDVIGRDALGATRLIGALPGGSNRALYTLDSTVSELDGNFGTDEVQATANISLVEIDGTTPITDPFVSFDTHPDSDVMYAVRDVGGAGTTFDLVTIDLTTGIVTPAGQGASSTIMIGVDNMIVQDIGFTRDGELRATEGLAGARRVITIDLRNPDTDTAEYSTAGSIDDNLVGFAPDVNDKFIGIQNNSGSNDFLFVSTNSIEFDTAGQPPLDATIQAAGVRSIAFAPFLRVSDSAQQAMFVLTNDAQILEVDLATGNVIDSVQLFERFPLVGDSFVDLPATSELNSIAFDQFGNMFVHDTTNARIVDIPINSTTDLSTLASITIGLDVATEDGSVRNTVGAIAFDAFNGRFLAADNAGGIVDLGDSEATAAESAFIMELRGVSNDTPVQQDIKNIFIGGKLTGRANFSGSVDTLYAGVILTGQTDNAAANVTIPGNFTVDGDLNNLISASSIGTNQDGFRSLPNYLPVYYTDFDMVVGGTLGQVTTYNSFVGEITVNNTSSAPQQFDPVRPYREIEGRQTINTGPAPVPLSIEAAWLGNIFNNEPVLYDGSDKYNNDTIATAQQLGTLPSNDPDVFDFAAVTGFISHPGIPSDSVDYYSVALMAGQTIEVVLNVNNLDFGIFDPDGRMVASSHADALDALTPVRYTTDRPGEYYIAVGTINNQLFTIGGGRPSSGAYLLTIKGVGQLGFGGIRTDGNVSLTAGSGTGLFELLKGDFGAIRSVGPLLTDNSGTADLLIQQGNLRSVVASTIGRFNQANNGFQNSPTLFIPDGGVGLFSATGEIFGYNGASFVSGNIQIINAAAQLSGGITTEMGIGVIRAGQFGGGRFGVPAGLGATVIVNQDNAGGDGVIDLVDVSGDLINVGFATNDGGNVRYMRVGGQIGHDPAFGSQFNTVTLLPGEGFEHVDDSGGRVTLNPVSAGGTLTLTRYGIQGSGGAVLVDVTSSTGGIEVSTNLNPGPTPVEISRIQVQGASQNVTIGGSIPIDVFQVTGTNIVRIENDTPGEIVNVTADSINTLTSNSTIGFAKNSTGTDLLGIANLFDAFPFNQQKNGVNVSGNLFRIQADHGIGNVSVGGILTNLRPNADGINTTGTLEGIVGPIVVTGTLISADLGEGIAPTGTGSFSHAGVYAIGAIVEARGQERANIWGDIVSQTSIGLIRLTNGSIIDARVATLATLGESAANIINTTSIGVQGTIGTIYISGNGGILGATILAGAYTGNVEVRGGFGIINSRISTPSGSSSGSMRSVIADGYGLLDVFINPGIQMDNIIATGRGEEIDITTFSESVRLTDNFVYHPLFDTVFSIQNDLNLAIVSDANFKTTAGQINDVEADSSGLISSIIAHEIINSSFVVANRIRRIQTNASVSDDSATIDTLTVTTGRLDSFKPGADIRALNMTVAGLISSVSLRGELVGNSQIRAVGPNAVIGTVRVIGDLVGNLFSDGVIKTVIVTGNMFGNITALGVGVTRGNTVTRIQVDGNLFGDVEIIGNAGTITVFGSLGITGDTLTIDGDLGRLAVGSTRTSLPGVVSSSVSVVGDLGLFDVIGRIDSTVVVQGTLSTLRLRSKTLINTGIDVFTVGQGAISVPTYAYDSTSRGTFYGSPHVTSFPDDILNATSPVDSTHTASPIEQFTRRMSSSTVDLRGLAARAVESTILVNGTATDILVEEIYAVDSSTGMDRLVRIDPETGEIAEVIGTLQDITGNTYFQHVLALAFDDAGRLIALLSDQDGIGATAPAVTLVEIDLTDDDPFDANDTPDGLVNVHTIGDNTTAGVQLDAGAITDAFVGLAVYNNADNALDPLNGTVFAVQRGGGVQDELVTIDPGTGAVTNLGAIRINDSITPEPNAAGESVIVGIGFDQFNDLIALHNDGTDAFMIFLDNTDLGDPTDVLDNADPTAFRVFEQSLLNADLFVGNDLRSADIRNGNLGTGFHTVNVFVNNSVQSLKITDGHIMDGFRVESLLGDIISVSVRNGSVYGDLIATNGLVRDVRVTGSDLGGSIIAQSAQSIRFSGDMLSGAVIDVEDNTRNIEFLGSVEASATIDVGGLENLRVGNDFAGSLNVGHTDRGTRVQIGNDWTLAPGSTIDSETRIDVRGDLVKATGGSLGVYELTDFRVRGNTEIDLFVETSARRITVDTLDESVITIGQALTDFIASGAVTYSLIQVGISAGNDGVFAATVDEKDANETSRIAHVRRFMADSMTNSIIAAGGDIQDFRTGTMSYSSVHSGLSLGSVAIRTVLDDPDRLNVSDAVGVTTELDAARSGADLALYHGDIDRARIDDNGAATVGSFLSAGVAPDPNDSLAPTGDFATFNEGNLLGSETGGDSLIERLQGAFDITGLGVFSDAPIRSNSTALVETTATYTVATDLADRDGNTPDDDSPLEASAGIATPGTPLTITNVVGTLEVRLSGPAGGSVELFDDDPTDGVIDAVVLTGTTRSHSLTITGDGDFSIARLLAADDATVRNFMFDGDIVGDDTDAPDIWIDGEVSRFQIRDLGTNVTGQIGGDVADLRMRDQGAGRLVIGGKVRTATIASASESPLLGLLTTFGNQVFNAFAFEDLGSSLWAHEGLGVLNNYTFDPLTDAVTFNSTLQVQDTFSDVDGDPTTDPVEVFGLDFLGTDLYGIIKAYDPQPVQRSAESLAVTTLNSLSNLAVDSANNVYAINSSGASNELVMIDPVTGSQTTIGALANANGSLFDGNVMAITFDNDGDLIALIDDIDGTSEEFGAADGVAIVEINVATGLVTSVDAPGFIGTFLSDGGAVTDTFTGLAVDPNDVGNTVYATRLVGGTTETLVSIDVTTGVVTTIGAVAGANSLRGIGFDEAGNLLAYDNTGSDARILQATGTNPATFTPTTTTDFVFTNSDVDAFAMGRIGTTFSAFALDSDTAEATGTLYRGRTGSTVGPIAVNSQGTAFTVEQDLATGVDQLISVDATTGARTIVGTLLAPAGSFTYTGNVVSMAFDNSDRLIAIINDNDGLSGGNDEFAIVEIKTTTDSGFVEVGRIGNTTLLPGVLLDGGGVNTTNTSFGGLAVDPNEPFDPTEPSGTIWAIRRSGLTTDQLVTIDPVTGVVTLIGDVQIGGGGAGVTNIRGIGFDADGNLIAYNSDGVSAELLVLDNANIDLATPASSDPSLFTELTPGIQPLAPDLDGFGLGRSGSHFRAYAIDANSGAIFTNPAGTDGEAFILGTIDTTTGAFTRRGILTNDNGDPVLPTDSTISIATDTATSTVIVVVPTADGGSQLITFDATALTGNPFNPIGPSLVDEAGAPVAVSAIDFDVAGTGDLIGFSANDGRIVSIDTATGLVTVETTAGVLPSTLTDLTHDPVTGEFLTFEDVPSNPATNHFSKLLSLDEENAGGIIATGVDNLRIGSDGDYLGRFVTTGNTFRSVTAENDFLGALITAGDITRYTQRDGVFGGVLEAAGDIVSASFNGAVTREARITAGHEIRSLSQRNGDFAGDVFAGYGNSFKFSGSLLADSSFNITHTQRNLSVTGSFEGVFTADYLTGTASVRGAFAGGANMTVNKDARSIDLRNGMATGSSVNVGNHLQSLSIREVFSGVFSVGNTLRSASLYRVDRGTLVVTSGGRSISVRDDITDSVISYGTDIGADGVYNTLDDLVYGGVVQSASFSRDFVDSAFAVGVLPSLSTGSGLPADLSAYLLLEDINGNLTGSIDAGGLSVSTVERFTVRGEVISSNDTRRAVLAVADGVDRLSIRDGVTDLSIQTNPDPFGPPVSLGATFLTPSIRQSVFSEPLNPETLILLDPNDPSTSSTFSIAVYEDTTFTTPLGNITLEYSEQTSADGQTNGIVTLTTADPDGFPSTVAVTFIPERIRDRTGTRSILNTFPGGDPSGSFLSSTGLLQT